MNPAANNMAGSCPLIDHGLKAIVASLPLDLVGKALIDLAFDDSVVPTTDHRETFAQLYSWASLKHRGLRAMKGDQWNSLHSLHVFASHSAFEIEQKIASALVILHNERDTEKGKVMREHCDCLALVLCKLNPLTFESCTLMCAAEMVS